MEKSYSYWLNNIDGLTNGEKIKLVNCFGKASEVYVAGERELLNVLADHEKVKCILNAVKRKESNKSLSEEINKLTDLGINFIDFKSSLYPERLRNIHGSPYGIYTIGKLELSRPTVGIVGSRRLSSYGIRMAEELGYALGERGVTVISGMARGCDSIAQEAALDAGGDTVAVLGCGADVCYPGELKKLYNDIKTKGCILSEFPPGTQPKPGFFPSRNRIIAALSDVLIVVEAAYKSGSLITADFALEQGKDVFACPGRIGDIMSAGCNALIAQGAGIITSTEDFLDLTGLNAMDQNRHSRNDINTGNSYENSKAAHGNIRDREKKTKISNVNIQNTDTDLFCKMDPEEKLVYDVLDDYPDSLKNISDKLTGQVKNPVSLLAALEIKGFIVQNSTGYYSKK